MIELRFLKGGFGNQPEIRRAAHLTRRAAIRDDGERRPDARLEHFALARLELEAAQVPPERGADLDGVRTLADITDRERDRPSGRVVDEDRGPGHVGVETHRRHRRA